MLTCTFCQNDNPADANYCSRCGRKLSKRRGLTILSKAEFCYNCGKRLELYPPERKVATILFADVSGFTAMSEKIGDIEIITDIMNDCFNRLSKQILDQGGSIDKYVGDMIMGRFGAPEALEDAPERAIRAALAMHKELEKISAELQRREGLGLAMRIGLNTGEVYAGPVGAEIDGVSYRSYTVMGRPVNLASRLEHESRVGKVLVGEETYNQTKHAFDFVDTGYRPIKGIGSVRSFEVIGPKPQRVNKRGLAGKDLQLIGRETELSQLNDVLEKAVAGRGQVISVVGEAGVGKSSLLREFKRRVNTNLPDVWYIGGAAFSYSSAQPYSLVRNAIFKLCNINDNDDEDAMLQKLLAAIGLLMGEAAQTANGEYGEMAALLGRAVGLKLPNAFIDNLDPLLRSNLLIDAISDFLLKKAETNPLILLLDDLHWADPSSLEVIDRLFKKVTGDNLPVLLLLLHRPDFQHEWPVSPNNRNTYHLVTLERLRPDQLPALVRQILEASLNIPLNQDLLEDEFELPEELAKSVARAEGNPFFIEEILKALLNANQIIRDEKAKQGWTIVGELDKFKLPDSLREILFTRVDRLDGRDKRVLQVGSVIGTRFEHRLLLAVRDLAAVQDQVDAALTVLHQEDFVETIHQEPEPEYGFRHSLTREVAYDNLLDKERRIYHEQIAQAIESYKADRLDYTVLNDLAYHYDNSNNDQKAILYLMQAGDMRKSLYRNDEALNAYYRAKERLMRQHRSERKAALLTAVNTNIGEILDLRARYAEAQASFEEALTTCDKLSERIDLWARIIKVLLPRGEFEEAMAVYNRAEQEFLREPHPDANLISKRAKLLPQVGWLYYYQSRYEQAIEAYNKSLELLHALPDQDRQVQTDIGRVYSTLGAVYAEVGRLDDSEVALEKAIEIAQITNDIALAARAYGNIAGTYINRSKLREAERCLKQARSNAEKVGDTATLSVVIGLLGLVAERQGNLVQSLEYYREAEANFQRDSNMGYLANTQLNVGWVLVQQGKLDEAIKIFSKSMQLAESLGAISMMAEAANYTGYAYLLKGELSQAESWLERGYLRSMESGSPEGLTYSNLYRAQLEFERHNFNGARHYLEESLKNSGNDPLVLGRVKRLEGRIACAEQEFNAAEVAFADSLKVFEPLRTYLEMSLTKLYWAELIWNKLRNNLIDPAAQTEEIETGQSYLFQASFTFDACEARLAYEEAQQLLSRFGVESSQAA